MQNISYHDCHHSVYFHRKPLCRLYAPAYYRLVQQFMPFISLSEPLGSPVLGSRYRYGDVNMKFNKFIYLLLPTQAVTSLLRLCRAGVVGYRDRRVHMLYWWILAVSLLCAREKYAMFHFLWEKIIPLLILKTDRSAT